MVEILVPMSLFFSVAIIVGLFVYFRYRARSETQKTLREAIERGQEMTPEFIKLLGDPPRQPNADLRRGIVALAIGAAFALFGVLLGEEDAIRPMLAVASFPCVIGLAYLALWKTGGRQE